MDHVETVKEIYAAFGRGDVPAILERVAEDVQWEFAYEGAADPGLPWLAPRRGRAGVGAFLSAVAEHLAFESFAPVVVVGGETTVVALCDLTAQVRKTGRRIVEREEPHVWHFDARGQVARFRHAADTLQQHRAFAGP